MTKRICVSIMPKTVPQAIGLIERAKSEHADFVEVRLDFLDLNTNLSEISKASSVPLIATNKLVYEKGNFTGSEVQCHKTLVNAAKAGFKYIDVSLANVDLKEQIIELEKLGAETIVSHHDYKGPLGITEMERILAKQIASGASICKIVTTAKTMQDNLEILNFVTENCQKTKLVCFCMGEQGKISRLLSPVFGAYFTFAALEKGSQTAPGQLSIKEMRDAYSLLGIT